MNRDYNHVKTIGHVTEISDEQEFTYRGGTNAFRTVTVKYTQGNKDLSDVDAKYLTATAWNVKTNQLRFIAKGMKVEMESKVESTKKKGGWSHKVKLVRIDPID